MDVKSSRFFGRHDPGTTRELAQHTVCIIGNFSLGNDFTTDGNLIMSEGNFARLFKYRGISEPPLAQVDVGLIKLAAETDPRRVKESLRQACPDVVVLTKQEFAKQEQDFWRKNTPIGFIFFLGLVMGFVVGVIICYQILSSDIADHLAEFATLKAIGYPNHCLTGVVLQEAFFLALFGFVPGVLLANRLYAWLENGTGIPLLLQYGTGLPMRLGVDRNLLVLVLTICMCLTSGLIAIRKVQAADPAEVF